MPEPQPTVSLPWDAPDLLSAQRGQLVVVRGEQPVRTLDLEQAATFVGRDPQSTLVLDHPSVSSEHFRIQREGDGWLLLDLGSEGGTYVDGARVQRAWLKPGSEITAGEVRMRFAAQKAQLRMPPSAARRFGHLVGDSVVMREVFTLLDRISPSEATLLMVGETGTGKGAMARSVHERSKRASGPFFLIDCGAISDTLIESELFGHERGAFTGADRQRVGLLEAASGGTLFLDEIDDLPLDLQPKLLRALEERVFQRVGSSTPIKFDARIIASSKKDLWQLVQAGRFREDLFFRLSVFTINLPPLRERREDIPSLAGALVGQETWMKLPLDVREQLLAHTWPGNVRELRNALERASHFEPVPGGITIDQVLPQRSVPPPPARPNLAPTPPHPLQAIHAPPPKDERERFQGSESVPVDFDTDYKTAKDKLLASFEREYLARLLQRTGGNVSAAARIAGIDRKHFSTLLRRHSLIGRR